MRGFTSVVCHRSEDNASERKGNHGSAYCCRRGDGGGYVALPQLKPRPREARSRSRPQPPHRSGASQQAVTVGHGTDVSVSTLDHPVPRCVGDIADTIIVHHALGDDRDRKRKWSAR